MKYRLNLLPMAGVLACALLLSACDKPAEQSHHIKVGISAGIDQPMWEEVKRVAKEKYQLDVEVVTFTDYVLPNEALNSRDIDANAFQHGPYLEQQMKERGYKLAAVGKTFVFPIAGYSRTLKSVDQLKDGSTIAIPNDPTNLGRSLLLLQKIGLIKVNADKGLLPTVLDITDNPHQLKIVEIEAAQLPRALDDSKVDVAIINTNYSAQIGLSPQKNGLFVEDKESPYVNLIVAREDNKDSQQVQDLVKAYHTDEVAAAAEKVYHGDAIKGW